MCLSGSAPKKRDCSSFIHIGLVYVVWKGGRNAQQPHLLESNLYVIDLCALLDCLSALTISNVAS